MSKEWIKTVIERLKEIEDLESKTEQEIEILEEKRDIMDERIDEKNEILAACVEEIEILKRYGVK